MNPGQSNKGEAAAKFASFCLGRYTAADGIDYLVDYANSSATFSVEVFKSVCEEFRKTKNSNNWRKPAAYDLVSAYKRRMANKIAGSRAAAETCDRCENRGMLPIVVGGDGVGKPIPIDPRVVKAASYAAVSLIPCDCFRGGRWKFSEKFDSCSELRRSFVFPGPAGLRDADRFAEACREEYRKESRNAGE